MGILAAAAAAIPAMFTAATSTAASFAAQGASAIGSVVGSSASTAGGADAASMFGSSVGETNLATGLNMAGDLFSGIGKSQQDAFQAGILRQNATLARQSGQYEESVAKLKTGEVVGEQRASQGASGFDVNSPTAINVRDSTQAIGALDAAMIHYNASLKSYGLQQQAAQSSTASRNDLLGGAFNAAKSFIGGKSSLSDRWSNWQMNFGEAPSGGGVSYGPTGVG